MLECVRNFPATDKTWKCYVIVLSVDVSFVLDVNVNCNPALKFMAQKPHDYKTVNKTLPKIRINNPQPFLSYL